MTGARAKKSKVGQRPADARPIKAYCDVPLVIFAPENRREELYRRGAEQGGVPAESIEQGNFIIVETPDVEVIVRRYLW